MTTQVTRVRGAFRERLLRDLLGALSVYGVAIGEALGLYAALDEDGPMTPAELAKRTAIAERYAREWLEQQAADGMLTVVTPSDNLAGQRYELPESHRDFLADREHVDFLAPLARLIAAGTAQAPAVAEAFRTGGGVPWDAFGPDMREAKGDANRAFFLEALPELLARLPDVHERLMSATRPARLGEVGSGMGWAAIGLAIAYPHVTVDGYDLDVPSVERARLHAHQAGVAERVRFHLEDGAEAGGQYDVVLALDCIHQMPQPVAVLAAMRAMMAPGAACIIMGAQVGDHFAAPADDLERMTYGYSLLVCLPDSLSHTPSVATGAVMRAPALRQYAEQAGFSRVEVLDQLDDTSFRFYRLHA